MPLSNSHSSSSSYLLQINESQRIALLRILKEANTSIPDSDNVDPITGSHPLEYWLEMLEYLPNVEASNPGILHDFCL